MIDSSVFGRLAMMSRLAGKRHGGIQATVSV